MNNPAILEIKSDQLSVYKQFLAVGLTNDEDNFRITVNDDKDAPFPTKGTNDSFTLGAYVNDTLTGVVSFARDGADQGKAQA